MNWVSVASVVGVSGIIVVMLAAWLEKHVVTRFFSGTHQSFYEKQTLRLNEYKGFTLESESCVQGNPSRARWCKKLRLFLRVRDESWTQWTQRGTEGPPFLTGDTRGPTDRNFCPHSHWTNPCGPVGSEIRLFASIKATGTQFGKSWCRSILVPIGSRSWNVSKIPCHIVFREEIKSFW